MINRSRLKFHETFQPELNYISKIMSCAAESFEGDKFAISEHTGIPTGKQKGKVEPSIKYAKFMGLVDYSIERGIYQLSLTDLGREVFVQDRYLHENLSKWICHCGISAVTSGAIQWAFLIHQAHAGYVSEISSEHLLTSANKAFDVKMSFEEMFGVIKRCYTNGCFLSLNFIQWDSNVRFLEHNENYERLFLYAYVLLKGWESAFPEKAEITINELDNSIGFARIFGFNESELSDVLESLSGEGIISVNRQLFPMTIVRTESANNVIPMLYSRLL